MRAGKLRQAALAFPGIGVALLPKLACPLCWPAYAAILSSVGLGFLISTTYLLPITIVFLTLTLTVLVLRAAERHGHAPFGFGLIGATAAVIATFTLQSNSMCYVGIGVLVVASVWNAWPRRMRESCNIVISRKRCNKSYGESKANR